MMQTTGFTVALTGSDHEKPNTCASCNGPRTTSRVLQTSKRDGNVTTILRMKMPYCGPCASRVTGAGVRMMVLFCLVTVLAVALPGAAGLFSVDVAPLIVALGGATAAVVLSLGAALLLYPRIPTSPATARGEAVTVTRYDDSGNVSLFCTNREWAERLAASNRAQSTPTVRYRLVESIALVWALVLAGGMVGMVGYAAENPPIAAANHGPSASGSGSALASSPSAAGAPSVVAAVAAPSARASAPAGKPSAHSPSKPSSPPAPSPPSSSKRK